MKTLIYALFLSISINCFSRNLYVAPSGNDASLDPENINTPLRTFSKACSLAVAGDKVYFRGGIYLEKYINFINSGNANSYIEFLNYNNEIPVFDGENANAYFILATSKNYIKINGIRFKKLIGSNSGIKFDGSSHHIEIRNCHFSELYFSSNASAVPTSANTFNPLIFCGSDNNITQNNIIVDNCQIYNCRTGYSEALTFVGNINGFQATNNIITNTGNIGIVAAGFYNWCNASPTNSQARNGIIRGNTIDGCKSLKAIAAGIYVDGGKNIIVEKNVCKNGQRGFQINCENQYNVANAKAENVIIRNNLAINNSRGGIGVGTCNGAPNCKSSSVLNCWVINNTCISNYLNQVELDANEDFGELNIDYSENTIVRNNIFYSAVSGRIKLMNSYPATNPINFSTDYNIWFDIYDTTPYFVFANAFYDGLANLQASGRESQSKFQNPNFVNATNDFRLSNETSPAYDFSDPSFITIDSTGTTDLSNKVRIKGFLPDAGAYEFQCLSSNININTPLTYKAYIFETTGIISINQSVSNGTTVTLNSTKAINFQTGFMKAAGASLTTQRTGCTN